MPTSTPRPTNGATVDPPDRAHRMAEDSVAAFASDLRVLRTGAGNPTLAALTSATGISKTVLSDAFAGKKLPTQNTVGLLAEALGADPITWLERRAALAPGASPATTLPVRPARRTVPVRAAVAIAAASAVLAAALTSAVWGTVLHATVSRPATSPDAVGTTGGFLPHADGVDPMQTVCREDAVIAASEEREDGDVLVQMMYSNACMAVWGRVTRYDGQASGNQLSMLIYPAIDLESSRNQERSAFDVQSLYTPLMIEPDVEARVCGIATITTDESRESKQLGPAMCI